MLHPLERPEMHQRLDSRQGSRATREIKSTCYDAYLAVYQHQHHECANDGGGGRWPSRALQERRKAAPAAPLGSGKRLQIEANGARSDDEDFQPGDEVFEQKGQLGPRAAC